MKAQSITVLAGDIGGTKANLAYFKFADQALEPIETDKFASGDYQSLQELIRVFVNKHPAKADLACVSVAGPVVHGTCKATNLPWIIECQALRTELKIPNMELINDLEANAHGIVALPEEDFVTINRGDKKAYGTAAVISAGTGLGEAGILWNEQKMLPFASEGGHADFAPTNEIQIDLLRFLMQKEGRVSYERVLSGQGLHNIYKFLLSTGKYDEPDWLKAQLNTPDADAPAVISENGLAGKNGACAEALNIFTDIYGAEAGNLALKLMATGGVYLGGGIAPKIIDKIREPRFLNAFLDKGRLRSVLEQFPINVIMNDKTALIGAARYALMHAGVLHAAEQPAPV